MKNLALVFLFLLAPLAAQQQDRILPDDVALEVVQNLAKTAYYSLHGTYDGFDAESVSLYGSQDKGDQSPWVKRSRSLARRLWIVRKKAQRGAHVHLMPSLLRNKRQCRLILESHAPSLLPF